MAWRFAIPAAAVRPTSACANCKCSTTTIRNTPRSIRRQYHGSAYAMVPAHRGYLRPTGEWNFEEVTVRGSTIKVELNGSVILDTDLARVTKFVKDAPHPGKDLKRGHFGFAGHKDPVPFRNVRIKTLE